MAVSTGAIYNNARLIGNSTNLYPLILCFHGSGDSCESWEPLAELIGTEYRVLLWDRQDPNQKPESSLPEMLRYLDQAQLKPPYVLIAHSYGGTFARWFLQQRPNDVAGMVLAETGQETALDAKVEQRQYKKQILGGKPLVVIRGDTLIHKRKQYEEALAAENGAASPSLLVQKQLFDAMDQEDERLKKAQLALSSHNRYVHVTDCGHDVVQDKPEVVADEIRWVMEHVQMTKDDAVAGRNILTWIRDKHESVLR